MYVSLPSRLPSDCLTQLYGAVLVTQLYVTQLYGAVLVTQLYGALLRRRDPVPQDCVTPRTHVTPPTIAYKLCLA